VDTASVPSWVTLLIQVPLVGVFIWYSLKMNQEFLSALDKRDAAFEARNKSVIEAIARLNDSICAHLKNMQDLQIEHDRYVQANVAKRRQS